MPTVSERVARFDEAVEKWLEPRRTPMLDHLFYSLSSAADHGMLWHGLGAARALRRRDARFAAKFSAALGVESLITNGMVKSLFNRVRPEEHFTHDDPLPYNMRRPITSSFPSGHAATAFTAALVLSRRRNAPAYLLLASLVASSRVYVRMHHASDVVAGAALGLVLGSIARRMVR